MANVYGTIFDNGGELFNVKHTDFGAKGDVKTASGASMNAGSAVLTTSSSVFISGDVGKSVTVPGAGASGADLTAVISSFTNGTQVSLSVQASTTVSNKTITYGTDDTAAVTAAIAALPAGGGTILFPGAGSTYFVDTVTLNKPNITLLIEGTIKKKATTATHVFVDTAAAADGFRCFGGTFDLSRTAFSGGQTVSAFQFVRTNDLRFVGVRIRDGIEEGLKLYKCQRVWVQGCRFENIYNDGIQFHTPATGSDEFSGGPSGRPDQDSQYLFVSDCYFVDIDDGGQGASNGVGIGVTATSTSQTTSDVLVTNCAFLRCVRGVWCESNDLRMQRVTVRGCQFNLCDAHGIGMVSVDLGLIEANLFHNIGTFVPNPPQTTSEITGITVSGESRHVIVRDNAMLEDRGTPYFQFGVLVSRGDYVLVDGNRIRGVTQKGVSSRDWTQVMNSTVIPVPQPMCRTRHSATQIIANDTDTAVAWDQEDYDTDDMHDGSTNNSRITINTPGKYRITAGVSFLTNATGWRRGRIMKSGAVLLAEDSRAAVNGEETSFTLTCEADFIAGDYVDLRVRQTSGAALALHTGTDRVFLAAELLGAR